MIDFSVEEMGFASFFIILDEKLSGADHFSRSEDVEHTARRALERQAFRLWVGQTRADGGNEPCLHTGTSTVHSANRFHNLQDPLKKTKKKIVCMEDFFCSNLTSMPGTRRHGRWWGPSAMRPLSTSSPGASTPRATSGATASSSTSSSPGGAPWTRTAPRRSNLSSSG